MFYLYREGPSYTNWYLSDIVRAARIALPLYAQLKDGAGIRRSVAILDRTLRDLDQFYSRTPSSDSRLLEHLTAVVDEQLCRIGAVSSPQLVAL